MRPEPEAHLLSDGTPAGFRTPSLLDHPPRILIPLGPLPQGLITYGCALPSPKMVSTPTSLSFLSVLFSFVINRNRKPAL